MVLTRTHDIDKDLWYRQGPMVLTKTYGIESVLLNHTHTRGPSVTRMWVFYSKLRMRDFFSFSWYQCKYSQTQGVFWSPLCGSFGLYTLHYMFFLPWQRATNIIQG